LKAPNRPAPDDGPEPYRTTPRRLSRQIRDRSVECADLAIRLRELAAFLKEGPLDVAVQELLHLSSMLSTHSIAVLVGKAEILPELADGDYRPVRPLLDAIESAPIRRAAEAIAPAILARGDTAEGFLDHGCNGACEPTAASTRRRKSAKGGVS
jgi:hypothetical protein